MNKAEFVRQLEYLLQDIPEDERQEAIFYYRAYLEDAGEENEEQVILEFGSPERVAAIIRSDLNGNLKEGGEFTESGYQDERFRVPDYQIVKRKESPEPDKDYRQKSAETGREDEGRWTAHQVDYQDRNWLRRLIKVGLLLMLLGVMSEILLGVGGDLLEFAAGVFCLMVFLIVCIGVLTVMSYISAVSLLIMGVGMLFVRPAGGVLLLGGALLALGCALIGSALSILVYGRFLPWCIRSGVDFLSQLLHGTERSGRA